MAWLTPEAATGDYACRRFSIPVELLPHFMGALEPLTWLSKWEPLGTMTPAEAVELCQTILNTFETAEGVCMEPLGQVQLYSHNLDALTAFSDRWKLCDGAYYNKLDFPDYWQQLVDAGQEAVWERDTDTFYVPDMTDRFPRGTTGATGATGGEDEHTLTTAEMPAHSHLYDDPTGTELVVAPGEMIAVVASFPASTSETGGGDPHNNLPPFLDLAYYIRIKR